MKLKLYQKYKESGVQWIGEIPEGWNTNKIKHNVLPLEKSGLEASEGNEEGKYPFFTSSQIQNKFVDNAIFNNECLILGTGGTACVHYISGKFSVSTDCLVLKKQKNINMKFLWYQILSNIGVIDDLGFWGMGLRHLQKDFFNNMLAYWPDEKQQEYIINFLDSKTVQLNQTIETDKKLIELLKEKRTALINHVVTKGLNPKAKMKKATLLNTLEIPENWQMIRIKFALRLSRGVDLSDDDFIDGGIPVYGSNGIIGYHNKFTTKGPGITVGRSGSVGEVNFVKENKYWAHNTSLYVQENYSNNIRYLYYLLLTLDLKHLAAGSAVGTLNRNNIHDIFIALPLKSEQIQISEYLDKTTSKIDKTIHKIEEKIELLEEYKKSLIHHVVTGKVDVRRVTV